MNKSIVRECNVLPLVTGIMGYELNGERYDKTPHQVDANGMNFVLVEKKRMGTWAFPIKVEGVARENAQNMRRDTVGCKATLLSYIGKILGGVRAIGCLLWTPITFLKYAYYSIRYLDNDSTRLTPEAKQAWKLAFTCGIWSPLQGYRKTVAFWDRLGTNRNDCTEMSHLMSKDKKLVKAAVERIKSKEIAEERAERRGAKASRGLGTGAAAVGQCVAGCLMVLCR